MLFPKLSADAWDDKDRYIREKMEDFYQNSLIMNQAFWAEADIDTRFYTGDQSIYNYLFGNVGANKKKQFNFNKVKRLIEMPTGYQRQNRKSTIVVPVENGKQKTSDQFSKLLLWNDRNEGVAETISQAFTGACITGMNILELWMDFRDDPISGTPKVSNHSYNAFLIDPYFRKPDLSDCNGVITRGFVTASQANSLLGTRLRDISPFEGYSGNANRDGKFYLMPESFNYDQKNLHTYDTYHYRAHRDQKLLVDIVNGQTLEWYGGEDELREFLQQEPDVRVIESSIDTVRTAILLDGKVVYDGPNTLGLDCYPLVPVMAYYTPETPYFEWRIHGIVRNLRDSQYLYNRRKVIELDVFESQVNSGYIVKEGTLVDDKAAYKTGQGQVLWIKRIHK